MPLIQGRVVSLSVRAAAVAGAWIGFGLGLVSGVVLGAAISWFAGAVLGSRVRPRARHDLDEHGRAHARCLHARTRGTLRCQLMRPRD